MSKSASVALVTETDLTVYHIYSLAMSLRRGYLVAILEEHSTRTSPPQKKFDGLPNFLRSFLVGVWCW